MPMTEAELLARLDAAGVSFVRHAHPPLHTVEESRALRGDLPGVHVKNLFLKDRAGALLLLTLREDRAVRLGPLEKRFGTKRLSFASAELLWERLGVRPGAVTPLALLNDTAREVRFLLDARIAEAGIVNVHPLHNEATLAIPVPAFLRVLAAAGHAPELVDLEALAPAAG